MADAPPTETYRSERTVRPSLPCIHSRLASRPQRLLLRLGVARRRELQQSEHERHTHQQQHVSALPNTHVLTRAAVRSYSRCSYGSISDGWLFDQQQQQQIGRMGGGPLADGHGGPHHNGLGATSAPLGASDVRWAYPSLARGRGLCPCSLRWFIVSRVPACVSSASTVFGAEHFLTGSLSVHVLVWTKTTCRHDYRQQPRSARPPKHCAAEHTHSTVATVYRILCGWSVATVWRSCATDCVRGHCSRSHIRWIQAQ